MQYRLEAKHGGKSVTFLLKGDNRQEAVANAVMKMYSITATLTDVRLMEKDPNWVGAKWVQVWRM